MNIKNHYGKWIDSESPTTGVVGNNEAEWLYEDIFDGIDLDYQEHVKNCEECQNDGICDISEMWDMSTSTILIGSWRQDDNGLYEPDKTGEYAAIVRETVIQVVWSRYAMRGNPCSPCYPGQVEFSHDGDFLAYCLPPDMYGDFLDDDKKEGIIELDNENEEVI